MATNARRLGPLVPWIALAAVTVFALVLLAERGPTESEAEREPTTAEAPAAVDDAARAAEKALDDALRENEALVARLRAAEADRDAARARADKADALIAVQAERLAAFETTLGEAEAAAGDAEEALSSMRERVTSLEARREAAEDRVLRWLRDVARDDEPERRRLALEGAQRATPDDWTRMAALVREDPERASAVSLLLASAQPSDAADLAALAVLEAGTEPSALPAAHLARAGVIVPALASAYAAGPALLEAVARHASRLDDDARSAVAEAAVPLVGPSEKGVAATRLVGILRAPGAVGPLSHMLTTPNPAVRAAAAYALSRVPDRAERDADIRRVLPALLADPDLAVRTAATLLAEAVLGERVAYDPAADPAAREKALETLKRAVLGLPR